MGESELFMLGNRAFGIRAWRRRREGTPEILCASLCLLRLVCSLCPVIYLSGLPCLSVCRSLFRMTQGVMSLPRRQLYSSRPGNSRKLPASLALQIPDFHVDMTGHGSSIALHWTWSLCSHTAHSNDDAANSFLHLARRRWGRVPAKLIPHSSR